MSNVVSKVAVVLTDIVNEVRKNLVGTVAKATVAAIIASAAILWRPIWDNALDPAWRWAVESVYPEKILTADEALRAAKWAGVKVVAAIPFRNKNDPNDYVLAWVEPTHVDAEEAASSRALGYGGAEAVLLVGGNGNFQTIRTQVPAMPGHVSTEAMANPDRQMQEGSLIDRDGDGVKEIFAISEQDAMTSAEHNYNLTLYNTGTRKAEQMVVTIDGNGAISSSYEGSDERLRQWFLQRFDEYLEAGLMNGCNRALTGELTCTGKDEEVDHLTEDPVEKLYEFLRLLIDDWVVANGADFTRGELKLKFTSVPPDLDLSAQACEVDAASFQLYNYFKGPLMIAHKSPREASILYLQDGSHHREIPKVILGERYIWLALAEKGSILAINAETFEVTGMQVSGWDAGIPSPWEEGKTLEGESSAFEATKELQLDSLDVSGGKLVYNGEPVILERRLPGMEDEFKSAMICDGFELRP